MIKVKILLIVPFFSVIINAQEFQGKAVYQTTSLVKEKIVRQLEDPNLSLKEKEQKSKSLKILENMYENSYVLRFNENASEYKLLDKIGLKADEEFTMPFSSIYYKDFKNGTYYDKKDMGGRQFIIHDSLPKYNWQLTGESKKIGNYTGFRAFYKDSIRSSKRIDHKNGGFEMVEIYKPILTEAWYSPELPISNGPHRFGGLPGLILEMTLHGGQSKLTCVSIELHKDQDQEIVFPKRKQIYTELEYEELYKKKE